MFKTLCPQTYNEALYVGHYFRTGVPVVMDLTKMPNGEAKQFVDFAAGLVFGRGGDMDRLAPRVFLLMPRGTAGRGSDVGEVR
ncbi:cell division protein SepF [Streptosporangium lutulentum]|uniref:FtsZ-interacting cell division protein YlmF n=1 Tax=Streptosporangium lutulentum TaxID=1461250 RepID=A0ABT9QLC6_9ACTN|nr:cell division protein SepF [Streptosporangium lutulentum]MDP9847068.1 FtsZ-interacting cell division protein YlmF [Streptosporangium lutulentum]